MTLAMSGKQLHMVKPEDIMPVFGRFVVGIHAGTVGAVRFPP
jgi:hypothetical protein